MRVWRALPAWLLLVVGILPAPDRAQANEFWIAALQTDQRTELQPVDSRFSRLTRVMEIAGFEQRLEFARIAVAHMLFEHEQALARLLHERSKDAKARRKLWRWGQATRVYLDNLNLTLNDIDASQELAVHFSAQGVAELFIDGRPVLVSSVNIKSPEKLGEDIVTSYCTLHDCNFLLLPESEPAASPPLVRQQAAWSFADGSMAAFVTPDGLHFMFADIKNRVEKERACRVVAADLRTLSEWLGQVESDGYAIEWEALRIESKDATHKVVVNRNGSFFRLALPGLSQADGILKIALPWLKARLAGTARHQYFPSSELFLTELIDSKGSDQAISP